jgi:protein TonB
VATGATNTALSSGDASVGSSAAVGSGAPGSTGTAGSGGSAADLVAYGRQLATQVMRQQRYPERAERLGMRGTVRIRVRVLSDGSLATAPRLAESSRFELLDTEALRMVEAAAPFAPLPDGWPHPAAEFVIPVRFSIQPPG